ncbi:MAG: helix-turn-helix domain-containing protein [Gelidibacter sp.]
MATAIITTEDLYDFKMELISEFKKLLDHKKPEAPLAKKYLKSAEVMDLLKISPGTLQNLRVNGTLPFTKIGGTILYEYSEILRILNLNKVSL